MPVRRVITGRVYGDVIPVRSFDTAPGASSADASTTGTPVRGRYHGATRFLQTPTPGGIEAWACQNDSGQAGP
jgi:hypothetical protein